MESATESMSNTCTTSTSSAIVMAACEQQEAGRGTGRGRGAGRGGRQLTARAPRGARGGARGGSQGRGRVRGRGRGGRGRGHSHSLATDAQVEASVSAQEQWEQYVQDTVDKLSEQDVRRHLRAIIRRQPAVVFDIITTAEPPPPGASVPWCVCGSCRQMPTPAERTCCMMQPCISINPMMKTFVLNEGALLANILYREDMFALAAFKNQDAGASNKAYRHAAYRHFILYQFGRLGEGQRRVVPSCCVWAIRNAFPDPFGQYTGFLPGRLS